MNPMKDWESIQPVYEKAVLPPGGYILKLCSAKEIRYEDQQGPYSKLEFCFDIDQGNYAGFYEKDYQGQIQMPKKWHGVLRQVLPQEDGSDQDIWRKSRLLAPTTFTTNAALRSICSTIFSADLA